MKQTAVEWYSNKLLEILGESVNNFTTEQTMANHYALKQAKEMFEQQIIDSFEQADMVGRASIIREINPTDEIVLKYSEINAEQYFKKTFK